MKNKLSIVFIALMLITVGCSSRSEQAKTVGEVAAPTVEVEAPESTAGRLLSQKEAESILPIPSEIGSDWIIDSSTNDNPGTSEDNGDFSNPECEKLLASLDASSSKNDWGSGTPVVNVSNNYTQTSEDLFSLVGISVDVSSYSDTVSNEVFNPIVEVFNTCNHFTTTDSSGITSTFDVFPLSMPNYGDNTFAIKIQGGVGAFIFVANLVFISVGHNIVSFTHFGLGGIDQTLLPTVIELTMDKLSQE